MCNYVNSPNINPIFLFGHPKCIANFFRPLINWRHCLGHIYKDSSAPSQTLHQANRVKLDLEMCFCNWPLALSMMAIGDYLSHYFTCLMCNNFRIFRFSFTLLLHTTCQPPLLLLQPSRRLKTELFERSYGRSR